MTISYSANYPAIAEKHGANRPHMLTLRDFEALAQRYHDISDAAHEKFQRAENAGHDESNYGHFTEYLVFSTLSSKINSEVVEKVYAKIGRIGDSYSAKLIPAFYVADVLALMVDRLTYYNVVNAFATTLNPHGLVINRLYHEIEYLQSYIGIHTQRVGVSTEVKLFEDD